MIKLLPSLNDYDMSPDDITVLSRISPFFNDVIVYSTIEQLKDYLNANCTELLSVASQLNVSGPAGKIDISINSDNGSGTINKIEIDDYFVLLKGHGLYTGSTDVLDKFLIIKESKITEMEDDVTRRICYLRSPKPLQSVGLISGYTIARMGDDWSG